MEGLRVFLRGHGGEFASAERVLTEWQPRGLTMRQSVAAKR